MRRDLLIHALLVAGCLVLSLVALALAPHVPEFFGHPPEGLTSEALKEWKAHHEVWIPVAYFVSIFGAVAALVGGVMWILSATVMSGAPQDDHAH